MKNNIRNTLRYQLSIDRIPKELHTFIQWVGWAWGELNPITGKRKKIPINPHTGRAASVTNPKTWADFDTALRVCIKLGLDGIGFVFTPSDHFVGIDLDNAIDPQTGKIDGWPEELIDIFDSYSEYSPSRTGVHIIIEGVIDRPGVRTESIEIYASGRFFTFTGNHLPGTPLRIKYREQEILDLYKSIIASRGSEEIKHPIQEDNWTNISNSDDEILPKAMSAANGAKFEKLFSGDWRGDYYSQSEGDLALCNMLAYWTGYQADRIDALFRTSGLMRPKWDEVHAGSGETYGEITIARAMGEDSE